ncbi:MAG: hypothetical protein OXQ92_16060 [Boseongicola sp.]|nr:hypothetical protein [Boseongicola sp.]
MAHSKSPTVLIVAQDGRLTYEAALFLASLRASAPDFEGDVVVAIPNPGPLWPKDPRVSDAAALELFEKLGASVRYFDCRHFGARYPNGNKIEALTTIEGNEPVLFFDTDTLILGDLAKIDFSNSEATASMARENTWPTPPLYGPGYTDIWRRIYTEFSVDFDRSLDHSFPSEHWEHYLYFNAGWIFHPKAHAFQDLMTRIMLWVRDHTPAELASQKLYPWLDQIALPVAITAAGGGRPGSEFDGLDGDISTHWRALPLFYAKASAQQLEELAEITAPNRVKKVLKSYEPFRRMIYHGRGEKVRALFDQSNLPKREQAIRSRIKRERLWMR